MTTSAPIHPANLPIPVDLFVSNKHSGLPRGVLGFADYSGNIVFRVNRQFSKSSSESDDDKTVLLDSAGNPLISIYHHHDGSWQGFKGDNGQKDSIFKVKRILNKFKTTELEVFLFAESENQGDLTCDFKLRGCHFQRSCTIYKGDSIVAQTSLMHKLRQIYVRRNKFRLTIFPGSEDPALIVALVDGEIFGLQREDAVDSAKMKMCDGGQLAIIVGETSERRKTEISWRKGRG